MGRNHLPEFTFELHVCRLAELGWPPGDQQERPTVVARQLGTQFRRWDTLVIEADCDAFIQRGKFGPRCLDSDLRYLLRNAPAEWAWYRDALPHPGFPWRYVRAAIHRAAARGVIEKRREGNRIHIKRKYRYPEWAHRIIAIENKPDLDASAARVLADQLQHDVRVGLADEVWVATQRTGASVEPALLERMPVEVGIAVVDLEPLDGEVVWRPRTLDPSGVGERVRSNGEIEQLDPAEKAILRAGIAERAWERGWRHYIEHMRPDCRHFCLTDDALAHPPFCQAHGRAMTPVECRGSCSRFEPEPPQWRMHGWPISGGPGKSVQRLLADQRMRSRPAMEE